MFEFMPDEMAIGPAVPRPAATLQGDRLMGGSLPSPLKAYHPLPDGQELCIAPALPSELPDLVALHLACFTRSDHFAILLGEPFIWDAYRWFLSSPRTLVLSARVRDRLVGLTAFSDHPYNIPMLRAGKGSALLGLLRRPWLAFRPDWLGRLAVLLFSRWSRPVGNEGQIAFTCIAPEFRGRGIGRFLKQASIQACQDWKVVAVTTAVRRENVAAKALNKRFGFVEVEAKSSERMVHLRLDLKATGLAGEVLPDR